jgi:hypothetical protein
MRHVARHQPRPDQSDELAPFHASLPGLGAQSTSSPLSPGRSRQPGLFIFWKWQDRCVGGGRKDVRKVLTPAPAPNDRLSSPLAYGPM